MKNREQTILVREDPGPVKIGTLCSDCTNPEEKVLQSFVFDQGNIIRLGMYEKARMSAEVLCEQGGDPAEIAREVVFPAVREALDRYEKGEVNKAHAVKSLEAAAVAEEVFRREMKDFDEAVLVPAAAVVSPAGERISWERRLLETSLQCCGYRTGADLSLPSAPKWVFVEVTPDGFSETQKWLKSFRREHPAASVILFGKYKKLIDRLKIDTDLYCKDPLFGGKIIGK